LVLAEPVFVVEVWSKSTAWIDVGRKLGDYQSVASIRSILFLAQDAMRGQLWTRDAEWSVATFEGPDSIIAIPSLGLDVALATFYQGVGL
jgi:Uma2 family endonuclease